MSKKTLTLTPTPTLLEWMRQTDMSPKQLHRLLDDVCGSIHTLLDWLYGRRRPDLETLIEIERLTSGAVTVTGSWVNVIERVKPFLRPQGRGRKAAPATG